MTIFVNRESMVGMQSRAIGSNTFATTQEGEPMHSPYSGGKSVWWTFFSTIYQLIKHSVIQPAVFFETVLAVYSGNWVSNLTFIANDSDWNGVRTYGASRVHLAARAGESFHFAVDGYGGASGKIALNLWQIPSVTPANDLFANRTSHCRRDHHCNWLEFGSEH